MNIEPNTLPWQDAYKLLIGSILPRPIAFVSTINNDGASNLAPFSFFNGICAKPFMVCFAPMFRGSDGQKKDTLRNIEETKEFVINIVSEEIAEKMNNCAIDYPATIDEFVEVGLTKEKSIKVKPFRVKESHIHLECCLHSILKFGEGPGAGCLVIGEVKLFSVDDAYFENGKIKTELLKPIGRLAGPSYTRAISDTFEIERKKL
ncbi:MAG: flavin reductase family protein [Bacillaceae bacterium]